ncbi:MAG: putative oar protein, partial [Gemmatimonadetes bacterium]|nr:putative oar protein [Gemmatimonadota bacterium]
GALINAVTRSGSNEFHGEVFGVTRNEKLQRDVAFLRDAPFKQSQYGFWVGGPIIRDRLQFSIAPEFQTQNTPASGPYVGQPSNLTQIVPVDTANQNRFCRILVNQYGYSSCGNFGLVTNDNPLSNLFARFDVLNLPGNSRAVVRYNFAGAEQNSFSRSQFVLRDATNGFNFTTKTNSGLAQLFTNLANGSSNEFLIGYTTIRDQRATDINAPQVTVRVPFAGGTGTASLVAGTENSSQGNALDQDIFEITNNFTFPVGTHRFTIGTKNEFFKVRNVFSQNSLGNYFFNSLDSLELGRPNNATLGIKVNPADPSDGAARFNARTLGFYAMDEWQATPNLSLQYGLRADLPGLTSQPGTNPLLRDSLGINTSNVPKNVLQWSPRFGFNWDVTGNQVNQLRGGAGVFVGRPAYVWLSNLFGNSGVSGYGNVVCSNPNTAPRFPGANSALPTNCNNSTGAPSIVLNTVDPDLKFPQIMRASLGFDRRLPGDFIATVEGLYTKAIQNFFYNNLGLAEPPATRVDRHGRLLYGDVVGTNIVTNYKPGLSDVINLTNQSKDYSYSMTGQLQKRFSNNFEGQVAYTFGHSYDVASLTSSVAASNFAFGRSVKGNLNDTELSISKFDSPHRIIAHGTYSFPSKTDVSVIFSGESGTPFDFVYSGDMNGDRQTSNDLIYVPRDARDPNEIQFTTAGGGAPIAQQQAAFEAFIAANECLDSQRGTIMNRNTCRTPWGRRLDVDIRQALPTFRGQNFLVQLDIFNFLNLLNRNWGAQDLGSSNSPTILTRQSFTPGTLANGAQGLYRFNPTFSQFNTQNASSNYSLQMQLKYTF